jgi:tetratricopeptide (TPR) repeat protein
MLTDEDKKLGHKLAGEWLEAHGEPDALLLGEHFEKGGERERAARYYLRAGEMAIRGGDAAMNITHAKHALDCAASREARIEALAALCMSHFYLFDRITDALPYAEEATQIAPVGSSAWAWGTSVLLRCLLVTGKPDVFLAKVRELRCVEPTPELGAPFALSLCIATLMLDLQGSPEEADATMHRLRTVAELARARDPMAAFWLHVTLGCRSADSLEEPETALHHCIDADRIALAEGNTWFADSCRVYAAVYRWLLGLGEEAERSLEAFTVRDEEFGYGAPFRPFALAWMLADRGAFDRAKHWAERLVQSGQSRTAPHDEGRGFWVLAEVLRRKGDLEAAEAAIQKALPLLRAASAHDVPGALGTLAALRLAQGKTAEAALAAAEGVAKYESMGRCGYFMRGAFLRLTHVEALEATGDHERAVQALAKARQCILANAEKIRDPALRKTFLENVPENRRTLELAAAWVGGPIGGTA